MTEVVGGTLAAGTSFVGGGGGCFDPAALLDGAALEEPAPKFQTLRTRDLAEERKPKRDLLFPISTCHVSI